MVKYSDKGILQKVRGSRMPIKIEKSMDYDTILEIAKKKHGDHDQYFCSLEDYSLIYSDNKVAYYIPGTKKKFSIVEYKKELGKPYSKIDMY